MEPSLRVNGGRLGQSESKQLGGWLTRMLAPWQSDVQAHEIAEERRFHIERRIEENVLAGMASGAARTDALRRFGLCFRNEERG